MATLVAVSPRLRAHARDRPTPDGCNINRVVVAATRTANNALTSPRFTTTSTEPWTRQIISRAPDPLLAAVDLWASIDAGPWRAIPMTRTSLHRDVWTVHVPLFTHTVEYTVRYRKLNDCDWTWMGAPGENGFLWKPAPAPDHGYNHGDILFGVVTAVLHVRKSASWIQPVFHQGTDAFAAVDTYSARFWTHAGKWVVLDGMNTPCTVEGLGSGRVRVLGEIRADDTVTRALLPRASPLLKSVGFCSWDAFYTRVTHKTLVDHVQAMQSALGVRFGWVVIDDGWQDVDTASRTLKSFGADVTKFPAGLRGAVDELKSRCGVQRVGVWHAVLGYWNGLAESDDWGELRRVPNGEEAASWVEREGVGKWFDGYYAELARAGVDFVKMDNIASLSALLPTESTSLLDSQLAASQCHFSTPSAIYSMPHTRATFSWLHTHAPTGAVLRIADDYFPNVPNSHRHHVYAAALNDKLLHLLGTTCDSDMFWIANRALAETLIAMKLVLHHPVYLSDRSVADAKRNANLIARAVARDGRVIRFPTPGVLVDRESSALWTHESDAVAVWRVGQGDAYLVVNLSVTAQVMRLDVALAKRVAVWSGRDGWLGVWVPEVEGEFAVVVPAGGSDVISLAPMLDIGGGRSVSVLGALDKVLPGAVVRRVDVVDGGRAVVEIAYDVGRIDLLVESGEVGGGVGRVPVRVIWGDNVMFDGELDVSRDLRIVSVPLS